MPTPRPPRPGPRPAPGADAAEGGRDDSPANLARMRADLEQRLDHQHWMRTCLHEAQRRLEVACGPGPLDLSLADNAAVSLEKIAAGESPPPGLKPAWYPPGHPLLPTARG